MEYLILDEKTKQGRLIMDIFWIFLWLLSWIPHATPIIAGRYAFKRLVNRFIKSKELRLLWKVKGTIVIAITVGVAIVISWVTTVLQRLSC